MYFSSQLGIHPPKFYKAQCDILPNKYFISSIPPCQAIIRILGEERRNRVLAGLYMGRSDVAILVRQAALHVWKVVVTNTPKTLREILPTLFSLLLGHLASTSYDKRQVHKWCPCLVTCNCVTLFCGII